ncbi:MAG: hypothetical protein M1835_001165 [Candelina submexicana]|nr:MAG: hypothetical protein M1835_001165 [Candelina submexicana]
MSFLRFLRAFSFSFISFFPCVASLPPEAGAQSLHPRQDPVYNCRPDYGIPSAGSCRAAINSIPVYPLHQDTNFGGPNSDVLNPFYRLPKTYTSGNCEIKLALPDGRKETEPESWDFVRSVAKDLIDACVANEAVLSGGTDSVPVHALRYRSVASRPRNLIRFLQNPK